MENLIIGVDHGYAAMKTHHCVFPTGLVAHGYAPYTTKNVLKYGGKYYVVGSGRQPIQKDKTQAEDYYLLTLAAVAQELQVLKADWCANIHLAAGLPLTSFGRDRERFRAYLLRDRQPVSFRYEEHDFRIAVTQVSLFPQGYAAALLRPELAQRDSVNIIDIGGWTCDLMRVNKRVPDASTCRSLEQGVIRCMDEMSEQIRREFALSVPAAQIQSVLQGRDGGLQKNVEDLIHQQATEYVQHLLSFVAESGMDIYATPTIFMGGGASLIRRYASNMELFRQPVIVEDVSLNAKAYEFLAGKV